MEEQLINMLLYIIPALVTGAIAFLFFREHIDNENKRRHFLINKELNKESLPLRLQAYERLTLFLERISPSKLLTRVGPTSQDKNDYENLLIANIEQEFEHNLSQQIYVSDSCWGVVNASKNATIQLIRTSTISDKVDSADKLREVILTNLMDKQSPSNAGLSYIRNEVSELFS